MFYKNMISFKANYISSPTVQKINIYKPDNQIVSFVELNPQCFADIVSANQTAINWDTKGGEGFGYDICRNINKFDNPRYIDKGNRFFAITSQISDLKNLDPNKILAMSQVVKYDDNTQFVEYLQVDPRNSQKSKLPEFRKVGTAMLNALKKLFFNKNIELDSVQNAVKFYLKNGFKDIGASGPTERRMLWECAAKTLH